MMTVDGSAWAILITLAVIIMLIAVCGVWDSIERYLDERSRFDYCKTGRTSDQMREHAGND